MEADRLSGARPDFSLRVAKQFGVGGVAALIEAVWPECVETLRPMVERVVHLSRQNKLEYRMNEEADSAVSMKEREGEGRVDGDAQGFMVVEVTRGRASSFDSDW